MIIDKDKQIICLKIPKKTIKNISFGHRFKKLYEKILYTYEYKTTS